MSVTTNIEFENIQPVNFPVGVRISSIKANLPDMGEPSITVDLYHDGSQELDFSDDWVVLFNGHEYVSYIREPEALKDTSSIDPNFTLEFEHAAVRRLKDAFFFNYTTVESGAVVPDQFVVPLRLTLPDFRNYLENVCKYWFGDYIAVDLNPDFEYSDEPAGIDISYSTVWDVILKIYDNYAARWQLEKKSGNTGYILRIGYSLTVIDNILEYGHIGGLQSIKRSVQNAEIKNRIYGRGGNKNLPVLYFKNSDPENYPGTKGDPDWVPELKYIPFYELRPRTFRDYVRGWKTNPNRQLTDTTGAPIIDNDSGEPIAVEPYDEQYALTSSAYRRGHTDTRFDPVEYVDDLESIARYGIKRGALENNDDIYPTIQGVLSTDVFPIDIGRLDEAVFVEQVSDVPGQTEEPDSHTDPLSPVATTNPVSVASKGSQTVTLESDLFEVEDGFVANVMDGTKTIRLYEGQQTIRFEYEKKSLAASGVTVITTIVPTDDQGQMEVTASLRVVDVLNGNKEISAVGIHPGKYKYRITVKFYNNSDKTYYVGYSCDQPMLVSSDITGAESESNTFHIWTKNIFNTHKNDGETDEQYSARVWKDILGSTDEEAAVVFASGNLSVSEDYKFVIPKNSYPRYDTSKTLVDKKGNEYRSHWVLTVYRSDADLDSTGLYVPNERRQGNAGDLFYFIGIELPFYYVYWAEDRLDASKRDSLLQTAAIRPDWSIILDPIRIHTLYGDETEFIANKIKPGVPVTIYNSRLIPGSHQQTFYISNINYTWYSDSKGSGGIYPDIQITLSDKYEVAADPVAKMESDISAISRQLGSVSNVAQIVRSVGDNVYLCKFRGDRTDFPLAVGDKLTAEKSVQIGKDFAPGLAGGVGGKFYVAEDGSVAGELDTLTLRRSLEVPLLRYNRTDISVGNVWRAPGGGIIDYVTKINDDEYDVALRLEDGEIGAVAVDDICMGIFHFGGDTDDAENTDGNNGDFTFAGFATVYFKITAVYGARNENFRCILRPDWYGVPPCAEMTFVAYGNSSNPLRQQSRYSTLTYERYLRGVNDYNFGPSNIAAQFGDLSNLSILGIDMSGYSAYLDNVYFCGTLQKIKNAVPELRVWRDGDYLSESGGITVHGELRVFPGVAQTRWEATLESGWADVDAAFATRIDRIQTTDSFSIEITLADLFNGVEYIDMARLKLTATYDNKTYTTYVDLVNREALQGEPGEKGEKGDTGPEGAVWRVRLWSADMGMCYAGQTEVDGVKYLDCAYTLNADGQPTYFLCIVDTEQSAATKPGSTGGTCWQQMSDIGPVYASALFAPNARINFLDGQEIVVSRDGEVIARLGTPDDASVIMWSGGKSSNEATYTLDSEGRARYGKKGGQRVEINPLSKAVEIYDASGARVALLSGDASAVTATTAPRLYPMVTSNLNIEDNGQTASATMCWFRSSAGQRGTFRLQCHFFAKVTGPTVWETPSDPSQPTTRYAAKVSARIYVDRQPNSGGTLERVMTIKDVTIDSDTVTSTTGVTVDEDINVQIPYDPNYRYRIQYEASVSYNGGKIAPRPQAMASLTGINSSTSYQISAAAYLAALYAGGLKLSASTDDYFSVSYSATNGIETEMLNKNGYGLRVTSTGVQIKRGTSAAWTNL